jgi:hypothetical protein
MIDSKPFVLNRLQFASVKGRPGVLAHIFGYQKSFSVLPHGDHVVLVARFNAQTLVVDHGIGRRTTDQKEGNRHDTHERIRRRVGQEIVFERVNVLVDLLRKGEPKPRTLSPVIE